MSVTRSFRRLVQCWCQKNDRSKVRLDRWLGLSVQSLAYNKVVRLQPGQTATSVWTLCCPDGMRSRLLVR